MPTTKLSTSTENSLRRVLYEQMVADGDYKALLGELLAVIHRDGGHYTELAGWAVSTEDAAKLVVEARQLLTEYRRIRRG